MCCGALVHARVGNLIFATREPRAGAVVSAGAALDHAALNHRVAWREGLLSDQSAALLQQFFIVRRADKPQAYDLVTGSLTRTFDYRTGDIASLNRAGKRVSNSIGGVIR